MTSVRVTATAAPAGARTARRRKPGSTGGTVPERAIDMWLEGKRRRVPGMERTALRETGRWKGPRLITEYSSTTFVAPGWTLRADRAGNLHLER